MQFSCNDSADATSITRCGWRRVSNPQVQDDMIIHSYSPWTTAPDLPIFMSNTKGTRQSRKMLRR